jgi:hypothetical protein
LFGNGIHVSLGITGFDFPHKYFSSENLKGRDQQGDLGVDGSVIYKWISKKTNVRLAQEHGNDP